MLQNKTVFVTGASGLLAINVIEDLLLQQYNVIGLLRNKKKFPLPENESLETVIIRPPLVYGAGVKGNFKRLLDLVKWSIPLPFGAIYNSRSMVSVENLVDLISTCLWHPNAANSTFLVSDDHNLSTPDLISLIAKTGGYNIKIIKVPLILLKFAFLCTRKLGLYDRLCRSMVVDCEHTKKQLDWRPTHHIDDSIKSCWDDFK